MEFKRFSQTNIAAHNALNPQLPLRSWDDYTKDERDRIWRFLDRFFFKKDPFFYRDWQTNSDLHEYTFSGNHDEQNVLQLRILYSINTLIHTYKSKNYGENYFKSGAFPDACTDFYSIFSTGDEVLVLEMLSFYVEFIFKQADTYGQEWSITEFKEFSTAFNEVLSHFYFRYTLTELGFVPTHEKKIIEEIYLPVIEALGNEKWAEVNKNLRDAFIAYRKNTSLDYSTSIELAITAIEAYLQILVEGKTGGGNFHKLLERAQKENLIINDNFSQMIFRNMESIFARERKEKGNAHAKSEYANPKSARVILDLAMIFLQYCLVD